MEDAFVELINLSTLDGKIRGLRVAIAEVAVAIATPPSDAKRVEGPKASRVAKRSPSQLAVEKERRTRQGALGAEVLSLERKRRRLRGAIPASVLLAYDILDHSGCHPPMAQARDGSCACCHLRLPPQLNIEVLRGARLQYCPHCRRMLFPVPQREAEAASGKAHP